MGDRTYVNVEIHKNFLATLIRLAGCNTQQELEAQIGSCDTQEFNDSIQFGAEEINYAEWKELEDILQRGQIEYDKTWERGGEYDGGEASFRCFDGKKWQLLEIYEGHKAQLDILELILQEKDLKAAIEREIQRIRPYKINPLHDGLCNSVKFIEKIK